MSSENNSSNSFTEAIHNWPEDFSYENGNYKCKCIYCGVIFIGHKRRVVCKKCANENSAHSFTEGADEGVPCIRGCKCYIPACVVAAKCIDSIPEVTIAIGKPETEIPVLKKAHNKVICRQWWDNQGLCDGECYFKGSALRTCQDSFADQILTSYKNKLKEEINKRIKYHQEREEFLTSKETRMINSAVLLKLLSFLELIDEVKL